MENELTLNSKNNAYGFVYTLGNQPITSDLQGGE